MGTSATAFEARLADDTIGMQVRGLIKHASITPPTALVRARYQQQETQYSFRILSVTKEAAKEKLPEPTEEALRTYFEENMLDYERPPRIKATYATAPSNAFRSEVEVLDDDIELYYIDNEREFRIPAKVKVRGDLTFLEARRSHSKDRNRGPCRRDPPKA
jgi:peptidyl-prolyl cis-trans isomerase D